jgi:hypothetical protein
MEFKADSFESVLVHVNDPDTMTMYRAVFCSKRKPQKVSFSKEKNEHPKRDDNDKSDDIPQGA